MDDDDADRYTDLGHEILRRSLLWPLPGSNDLDERRAGADPRRHDNGGPVMHQGPRDRIVVPDDPPDDHPTGRDPSTPVRVPGTGLPAPRGWQRPTVDVAVSALTDGGRGQIIAACGTGKSITSAHIALRICPAAGLAVVACPSVALVAQTLQVWAGAAVLAVCSDEGVVDPTTHVADLPAAVTTDPGGWTRTRQLWRSFTAPSSSPTKTLKPTTIGGLM